MKENVKPTNTVEEASEPTETQELDKHPDPLEKVKQSHRIISNAIVLLNERKWNKPNDKKTARDEAVAFLFSVLRACDTDIKATSQAAEEKS